MLLTPRFKYTEEQYADYSSFIKIPKKVVEEYSDMNIKSFYGNDGGVTKFYLNSFKVMEYHNSYYVFCPLHIFKRKPYEETINMVYNIRLTFWEFEELFGVSSLMFADYQTENSKYFKYSDYELLLSYIDNMPKY